MPNRRHFIKQSGLFLAATTLPLPDYLIPKNKEKLGVALVGLGNYSSSQLAPALQETRFCELRGIVTGSPQKIPVWQKKYGIKDGNVYNYENMPDIANNEEIDVIYIVLPTGLHAEYAIKAAETGKHVWCEKPMARTAEECKNIINACEKNKVKLSIGYRMQHEANTQKLIKWADTKPFGAIKSLEAEAGYYGSPMNPWKLKKEMGGGAMYDMGVYPLNAARYSTGMEPIAVSATHSTNRPEIFTEVDETTSFELEFPDGITAKCKTSFGENLNNLEINCENGWYYLRPFQSYSGVKGKASDGTILPPFGKNQQAVQMDDDARAILNKTPVLVPGEDGLRDIVILEKIYESAAKKGERLMLG
ncbi:MAG: Gfo/Idh/MocA family oxidoreductase [Salegentibacter sp.]|uniref:Glucose-fructose oxidoreductase n=1 Tax=Salegentibacter flavus TaxID=287099 RepID=A0A1I5CVE6_9FLAO|nr:MULTISPECIES: Gfo/Idh/MocA family oxidoreductase [Salegentibacter]MDR9457868.1 Gfo/Idh/MocA family oxidoreductase [Salegentibacter sp.]SFN90934.1 glucose-fructose oxidoreductase [Salegentibacter flavus]